MKEYIRKNRDMIDCCLILLVVGACTGIFCTSKLNLDLMNEYSGALISTLVVPTDIGQFFIQQSLTNILLCGLLFFLGFSVLGIPLIQFGVFLKGFQIGFSCALFLITYQIKGILGIMMTLFPQIIFDTLAIGVIAISSIQLSGVLVAKVSDLQHLQSLRIIVNRKLNDLGLSIFLVFISSIIKSTVGLWLIEIFAHI